MKPIASVRVRAPAKINPWLQVLGRRTDGFHELDLGYLAIDVCDVVTVHLVRQQNLTALASTAERIRTRTHGPLASPDIVDGPSNLAWRAATLAWEQAALSGLPYTREPAVGLLVELEKHIPSQAGLGGASSDAAAAWLGARAVLGLGAPTTAEQAAFAALGADCAFFASVPTGYAHGRGRGDQLEVLPACSWHVGLVTPDVGCPTAHVYASLGLVPGAPQRAAVVPPRAGWNDLEAPAIRVQPRLSVWREALLEAGCGSWFLTGSGSSFCGLYEDASVCQSAVARLGQVIRQAQLQPRLLRSTVARAGLQVEPL